MEAAQATFAQDYHDVETWTHIKELHRKVSTLSTAIVRQTFMMFKPLLLFTNTHASQVFLGCPHRAESIEVLEDELHNLMSLPGPDVRKGIMRKIRDVAHHVNNVNIRFLDTNLFSRLATINVFYLSDLPNPETEQEPSSKEVQGHQAGTSGSPQGSSSPLIVSPTPPTSPFSRYTLTINNWPEFDGRYRQSSIDHAGLVRGDEGVDEDESWVTKFRGRFRSDYYRKFLINLLVLDSYWARN